MISETGIETGEKIKQEKPDASVDAETKTSYDRMSYVYNMFSEGDINEEVSVYDSSQDISEKCQKKHKNVGVNLRNEAKNIDNSKTGSENNSTLIIVSSVRSIKTDKDKFLNSDGTICTKNKDVQINTMSTPEIVMVKNIKQEKPDVPIGGFNTDFGHIHPKSILTSEVREPRFLCASCQFCTTNEINFMMHIKCIHRTEHSLWCKYCDKCFSNVHLLIHHIKAANCQKQNIIYNCGFKTCMFETSNSQTFNLHLNSCHKRRPFHFCVYCNQPFTLPHCLILHLQNDCPSLISKKKKTVSPTFSPVIIAIKPVANPIIQQQIVEPVADPVIEQQIVKPFAVPVNQQIVKLVSPSDPVKSTVVIKTTRALVRPIVTQRVQNRKAKHQYLRNSKCTENNNDDNDSSSCPEKTASNQPLRQFTRLADRISEAEDLEIEPDTSIVSQKKIEKIKQPASKVVHCHCCIFSAAFKSMLDKHYADSCKDKKQITCMVCNVKFENVELFVKHFENYDDNKGAMDSGIQKSLSDFSNDSSSIQDNITETPSDKKKDNQSDNLKDIPLKSADGKFVGSPSKHLAAIPYQTLICSKIVQGVDVKNFEDFKSAADVTNMKLETKLKHFFKCTMLNCSYTTDHSKFYYTHINGKHNGKMTYCSYCYQNFQEPQPLIDHMFNEHSKRCFQCSLCFYRAFSKAHVQIHINHAHVLMEAHVYSCTSHLPPSSLINVEENNYSETTIFPYICAFKDCKYKTFKPKEFRNHNSVKHKSYYQYFCYYCKMDFLLFDHLMSHYCVHGINNFQCTYCVHGSETLGKIFLHLCNCHADKPLKVYFRIPQNMNGVEDKIIMHSSATSILKEIHSINDISTSLSIRKHHIILPTEVLCLDEDFFCRITLCNKQFKNINTYLDHIKEIHCASNIPCPYCSKVLTNNDNFGDHMMCHGPNLYACSKQSCNWYSFQKSKVTRHMINDHQEQGEVKIIRKNSDNELDQFKIKSKYFSEEDNGGHTFICLFCYYKNGDFKAMKNHIYAELCYSRFQCHICKERLCSRKLTMAHFSEHHMHHNIKCEIDSNTEIEILTRSFLIPEVQTKFFDYVQNGTIDKDVLALCEEYKCNQCNELFSDIADWHLHWQNCLAKAYQPFTCHCSVKFSNSVQLKHHTHKEHLGKPISFTWTENEFWKKRIYKELQCGKLQFFKELFIPFLKENNMQDKFKIQSKYYQCDYCDFNDAFRSNIEKHIAGQHKDKVANVKKIKSNIPFPELIKSFINQNKSTTKISLEPMDVTSTESMKQETTLFVCSFCNKETLQLKMLDNHVENFHKLKDSYPYFYFPNSKLKFMEKDSKLYDCAYCNISQENLFHLKKHYRNLHCELPFKALGLRSKNLPPLKCQYCNLKATSRELLDNHCLFHHSNLSLNSSKMKNYGKRKRSSSKTEEPPVKLKSTDNYKCPYCKESFIFYINIVVHHKANHPETAFKFTRGSFNSDVSFDCQRINCDFCAYFGEQKFMSKHLSLKHKNCFVCAYCGQGCNSATSLVNHSKDSHKNKSICVVKVNLIDNEELIKSSSKSCTDKSFSFYGIKPKPIDLHNITVSLTSNVSSNNARIPVIYLSQMFSIFPKVYVNDFKKQIL